MIACLSWRDQEVTSEAPAKLSLRKNKLCNWEAGPLPGVSGVRAAFGRERDGESVRER